MSILKVNSRSIDQGSGEIWTIQTDLQQISPKSDSLLGITFLGICRFPRIVRLCTVRTVDRIAAGIEQIGHVIKIFRVSGKIESVCLEIPQEMLQEPLLGCPVEINHDVSAENSIVLQGQWPYGRKQVEWSKSDHLLQFGTDFNKTFVVAAAPQEVMLHNPVR